MVLFDLIAAGRWLSPGILASSTNKTDHYDITDILINTLTLTLFDLSYRTPESYDVHLSCHKRSHFYQQHQTCVILQWFSDILRHEVFLATLFRPFDFLFPKDF